MREQLQSRLQELEQEFGQGQTQLKELNEKRDALEKTLLRISGAIQVLHEELQREEEGQEAQPMENGQHL